MAEVVSGHFEKPHFVVSLQGPSEANEGEQVTLQCKVAPVGDPTLDVTWYRNGVELPFSNRIAASSDFGYVRLDIASVTGEDSAIYMVK